MMKIMTRIILNLLLSLLFPLLMVITSAGAQEAPLSEATETCLECHLTATPGLVADWQKSRHRLFTPAQALAVEESARKVSAALVPEDLAGYAVGCAECHTLNPSLHRDTFDHEGILVHTVVTPQDCAVCHAEESRQFIHNKMSQARGNLKNNRLYQYLIAAATDDYILEQGRLIPRPADALTLDNSCYFCHGTQVKVNGAELRETDFGDLEFPVLSGWPNQGVGRLNPDGSLGSCAACHTRHQFSLAMARQPATCSQCHKGPDVPAYKVYQVSKHGNIYNSLKKDWDFMAVPWTAGRDFTAPTCAVCHVSLVVDEEGTIRAERSHRMNNRLPWRLLGLIYAHPQPEQADTSIIRNKGGLPLPTELTGEPVREFLISPEVVQERTRTMQNICLTCHSQTWVQGHWRSLEDSIAAANRSTLTATRMMEQAWAKGLAQGLAAGKNPFDEALERKWVEHWLFYANTIRLSAAMGGGDYGVFENGRWQLTGNLQEMVDRMKSIGPAPGEK